MTVDAWVTLAVIVVVVGLLVRELLAPALVIFGADVLLLVTGVIDAEQALSGFSNPAPFTIASLYVLARAVEKTGGIQPLVRAALKPVRSARHGLTRIMLPVAVVSAVVNNTPVVAITSPQVVRWARSRGWAPSAFLMPLSFAAILGGTLTAIGSSTTLVVSGLMEEQGLASIGMFEITSLALPVAVTCLLYLFLAAPRILPNRKVAFDDLRERTRDFIVQMTVVEDGPIDGASVEEAGLRHLHGLFLIEVRHPRGETIAPAGPDTRLAGGDILVFAGRADQVLDLQKLSGLRSAEEEHAHPFTSAGHAYFEAVVGAGSPLVGKTLRDVSFRSRYQAAVLGVHRAGSSVRAKLGALPLRPGDTLLILSDVDFLERWRDRSDFLLVAPREGKTPTTEGRSMLVAAALAGVVTLSALGLMPILTTSLLAALLMVAFGVLTLGEARRAIDIDVIVLIAGAFGMAAAIQSTGLAETIAAGVIGLTAGLGDRGVLLGIVLLTLVLTELITNNAAALLVFPVAMAAGATAGFDPRTVALVVAVAASASFLTPIGYQTNTMVYGPGGYRFLDYARLGFPLSLIVVVILVFTAPI